MDYSKENRKINECIKNNNVEFIDFGASKGGSIDFAKQYFCKKGGDGIGIDFDEKKLQTMENMGYNSFFCDITKLQLKEKVRFVIMSHFLEHLRCPKDAKGIIDVAVENVKDFVYINHPYFDADGYLFSQGFKFYWSDWHGHTNHMQMIEFKNILQTMLDLNKISRFAIYGCGPIKSSASKKIHPLSSSMDQHDYDKKIHPKKNSQIKFSKSIDIFKEIRVLIVKEDSDEFISLEKSFRWDKKIYDSIK